MNSLDADASFVHKINLKEFLNLKYALEETMMNVVFLIKKIQSLTI
jgi:hypothetical protein